MKTEIQKPDPKFQPRSLTITFESQKELDTFGRLLNYRVVADTLRKFGGFPSEAIYDKIVQLGGDINNVTDIVDYIKKNI